MRPTYTINLKRLEENYLKFSSLGEVFFPVKTNNNPIILKKLVQLGSGFECDSIDHIKKVLNKKNAKKIIFSNVVKTQSEIDWSIKHGIIFFTIDDEKTLSTIIFCAQKHHVEHLKINVRLNVFDIFRTEFQKKGVKNSHLGAEAKQVENLLNIISKQKGIEIEKGISFYVQAEMHNKSDILEKVSDYIILHFANKIEPLNWINIGGGRPWKNIYSNKKVMLEKFATLGAQKIILEPGRFLVDGVENLFVPVLRTKTANENAQIVASVGVGIYHGLLDIKLHSRKFEFFLATPLTKKANCKQLFFEEHAKNSPFTKKQNCSHKTSPDTATNWSVEKLLSCNHSNCLCLRGPTADSADLLGQFEKPSKEITSKSIVTIKNVGAYVEVLHSTFSGKIKLAFVTIK